MKKYLLLGASYVLPLIAFAHGEVDDGHTGEELVVPPSADERQKVAIGLAIAAVGIVGLFWYTKKKNAIPPAPPAAV